MIIINVIIRNIRIIYQKGSDECGGTFGRLSLVLSQWRNRPYKVGFCDFKGGDAVQRTGSEKNLNNLNKGRMMKNVMDNRNNSPSLMACWPAFFIYLGRINPYSSRHCHYCNCDKYLKWQAFIKQLTLILKASISLQVNNL